MSKKNRLIIEGHWWLPTNPDSVLQGTLTFDYQKEGLLVISGQFHLPSEFHLTRYKENFIILGKSTDGKKITLIAYHTGHISEGHDASITFNIKLFLFLEREWLFPSFHLLDLANKLAKELSLEELGYPIEDTYNLAKVTEFISITEGSNSFANLKFVK